MVIKKNIAIILARGGSKRIPKKNIILFKKKPLIAWTIEAAINSKIFDKVIVSTDSVEIREVSEEFGAEVPFLRKKYSDDNSISSIATLASLEQCKLELKIDFENVFQLMPTCPLRGKNIIISANKYFKESKINSLLTCSDFAWQNPYWSVKLNKYNIGSPIFPDMLSKRSQDQKKLYGVSGAVWISKSKTLRKYKTFYSPKHRYFPIDWNSAIDIDTYDDLKLANFLSNKKKDV